MPLPAGARYAWTKCSERMVDGEVLFHDASTLGGNSGSCVFDLRNAQVAGAHFGGEPLAFNAAVALWTLADDPLLKAAGLNWG